MTRGRTCSPARSSRPTRRTRSPRSPASSCARPTAGSTAATSSRRCRPTSTARTTTSTSTQLARAAGADPQVPRGQDRRARRGRVWGTGTPRREFLHVDDLADACVFLMRHYDERQHINVGTGEDLTIRELAEMVRDDRPPGGALDVRHVEARRHAAQAARRLAPARARLAAPHRSAGGHRADLPVVPGALEPGQTSYPGRRACEQADRRHRLRV